VLPVLGGEERRMPKCPKWTGSDRSKTERRAGMTIETVSFVQIITAVTAKGAVLYGLTANGAVYEYNFSREVWIPIPMRALPENEVQQSVIGLRGPSRASEEG
jgi:hypothetical protein